MLSFDLPTFPVLATQRMVLRELRPSDAGRMFAMRSDPEVMRHVNRPLANTIDDASALITLINTTVATRDAVQWAITEKDNDAFIGLIGFWRMQKENYLAELGYMLVREHWGRGLISEAIDTVVHFGFNTLELHRVEAITRPANIASVRALESNGFVQEAHFKESVFFEGVFHDALHFGRLAP